MNEAFKANADLDDYQYHIVVNSATNLVDRAATLGEQVIGVLQNKPKSGEFATIEMLGVCRVKAGATIVAGAAITTTVSATAITVASSNEYTLGTAITSVASGGVFTALLTHAGNTKV